MNQLSDDDISLLRDTAKRFFEEKMPIDAMRAIRDEQHAQGFDAAQWAEMAEMGWPAILIDEQHGGIGFGHSAMGHILEASGHTLAASPLFSTGVVAASLLSACDDNEQAGDLLSAIAAGEVVIALAIDETPRHQPGEWLTTVTRDGEKYSLSGNKTFVLDGHVADHLVVAANSSDGTGTLIVLVDAADPAIRRTRTTMVDGRNAANIEFDNVVLAASAVLCDGDAAVDRLTRALDAGRAAIAAEMLGSGQEAFDRTIEYLKIREQFDAPIGSFQALKHRAAEMYCQVELARSAVYAALEALDENAENSAEIVSMAKVKACEMLELVSNEALQMHGGIGMTDEADIGLFLKRARVAQQIFGDAVFHRNRYADLIGI